MILEAVLELLGNSLSGLAQRLSQQLLRLLLPLAQQPTKVSHHQEAQQSVDKALVLRHCQLLQMQQ
jgi:hypothetical protein